MDFVTIRETYYVGGRRDAPAHEPEQGQLPRNCVRPQEYVRPVEPRSVALPTYR